MVYLRRFLYKICCLPCRILGCCWMHTDSSFPPDNNSLGNVGGDSANADSGQANGDVVWLRANEFPGEGKMQLFGGIVEPRDICQGALGDCWLLAALACLAEKRGAISALFKSKERNPRGKYRVRIYDGSNDRWENVIIDDHIPCDRKAWERDGTCKPMFCQPNGNELYVMLLEKAFAKFCGSYAAIEGGQTIWAIRAMTGDPARWFMLDEGRTGWKRYDMIDQKGVKDRRATYLKPRGEQIKSNDMFEVLLRYHKRGSVLCASGSSGKDGLHQGHAYSIIDVRKVSNDMMGKGLGAVGLGGMGADALGMGGGMFRLVQIRNPWGTGEWKGDWSDKSDLWDKYPEVKRAVGFEDIDDGAFWMSWADYCENWSKIGVVDRTVDINSLSIQVGDDSCCAPVKACLGGCCHFWCCCDGARRLYFPYRSSDETVKVGGCCGMCKKSVAVQPT